jgi:hypothetical protein
MAEKKSDKSKSAKADKAAKPAAKPAARSAKKPAGKPEAKAAAKAAPKKVKSEAKPAAPRGPLARLKALHGSKDALVAKLVEPLAGPDEDTDALGARLKNASNQQLLRLAAVVEAVRSKYGSREKLIAALAAKLKKAKDQDYLTKLGSFSLPKLWDVARSVERRA